MDNELKYWLGFSIIETVGTITISDLFMHFRSMEKAWNASEKEFCEIKTIRSSTYEHFKTRCKNIRLENLENNLAEKNILFVTLADDSYPELLKNIDNPPGVLFYKGDFLQKDFNNTLDVVGSRKCSASAIENTKTIVKGLQNTGTIIVSGGAAGIDTASHIAALEAGLETIVVLGGGFDNLYPKQNKNLFEKIITQNGVLLSEYYPSTLPDVFRFPQRNRIISGLSQGTLVVEAGEKSGALITARLCLEQGRELMCLPGMISNPNTQGTHKLLKDGAALVSCSEDILNYLNWNDKVNLKQNGEEFANNLTEQEKIIYDIVSLEPISAEDIINKSNIDANDVMIILTMLELKGIIKQLPGEIYMRV